MPGIRTDLLEAGATRVAMLGGRWLTAAGWMPHVSDGTAFLSCTRPPLDDVVLRRVRTASRITVLEGTEAVGLTGDRRTVRGVRIRERGRLKAEARELSAALVVDASGRRSSLPSWLASLGCPRPPEDRVDAGVAYSSRLYRRQHGPAHTFIYLQTKAPDAPRVGVLLPVEGERWIVSVGGMRGSEPEPGDEGFEKQLALLRDPILKELLTTAEPLSHARGFRPGPSVRRRYDKIDLNGLVVVGDAHCSLNPVYGQGITVAALSALALQEVTSRHGSAADMSRAARKAITKVSMLPWLMSSCEDARFHTTLGGPSDGTAGTLTRLQQRCMDLILAAAIKQPKVAVTFCEVVSLVTPAFRLLKPSVAAPAPRCPGCTSRSCCDR